VFNAKKRKEMKKKRLKYEINGTYTKGFTDGPLREFCPSMGERTEKKFYRRKLRGRPRGQNSGGRKNVEMNG